MDAESEYIEKLKTDLRLAKASNHHLALIHETEIERLKALIVELAEAVQYCHVYRINDTTISEHRELMQRAREVTR